MLIETLIFAIFMGYIKGGKLNNMRGINLRASWLVILAFIMQVVLYGATTLEIMMGPDWLGQAMHLSSYFLLLIFIVFNYALPGVGFMAFGVLLNGLVIGFNNGLMPVDPTYLSVAGAETLRAGQGIHSLLSESTKLSFLADIIYLDIPGLSKQFLSIGDILLDIGVFMLVFQGMTAPPVKDYSAQYFRQSYSARNWPQ